MPVIVNTNVASLTAQRTLGKSQSSLNQSLKRLSTGMRINSAADDSAGLAISEKFKSKIRSLEQAQRNAGDGISLIQTAEGSVDQMTGILNRMRELAVQASTGTISDSDRSFIHSEFTELRSELDRIADTTEFNGKALLQGSASAGVSFQVGTNNSANDKITVSIANIKSDKLGGTGSKVSAQSVSTSTKALKSLSVLDTAINELSAVRSSLGSVQNRLDVAIENLGSNIESMSAANSRIRDVDVAKETANMTKQNILVQAGVSVLAQANQAPQVALSLLG